MDRLAEVRELVGVVRKEVRNSVETGATVRDRRDAKRRQLRRKCSPYRVISLQKTYIDVSSLIPSDLFLLPVELFAIAYYSVHLVPRALAE